MNFLSTQQQGALYAISSGLCYGFLGYFGVTLMNSGLSILNMLFWRFMIATLFMLIILAPKYKMLLLGSKESLQVLFYGMAFYSGSAIFYFIASKYIGTGLAMVMFFTYPAMVMLFNVVVYKTKVSKVYYFAVPMLIIGMICLVDTHEFTFDLYGIALGTLSSFCYACYILASKKTEISPTTSTLMVSAGSAITCLIASFLDSSFYIPSDLSIWFNIVCVALVCTALPILLLLQGLKYISSEKASMLSVLEPIFVIILGVVLLDEKISTQQIIGTIIVLSGALITLLPNKSK